MLEVRLIGTFAVEYDGNPVTPSSYASQYLFAYLILTAGTSPRLEKFAGMFWPEKIYVQAVSEQKFALLLELLERDKRCHEVLVWPENRILSGQALDAAYLPLFSNELGS